MNDIRKIKAIPEGQEITLNNEAYSKKYSIEKVIGYGGNGIVYTGRENKKSVIIKEFFPLALADYIERDEDKNWSLTIRSNVPVVDEFGSPVDLSKKFKNGLARFETGCERHVELFEKDRSRTLRQEEYFKDNGTAYSILTRQDGDSLDKNKGELSSLGDVVKLMQSLTEVIGRYHDKGWLHLDIKPSNIYKFKGENRIAMFDFDSAQTLDEIQSSDEVYLSYSDGWSAPELTEGRVDDIGKHTDIFSIGAVLFWLIFGRKPTEDDLDNITAGEFGNFKWKSAYVTIDTEEEKTLKEIFSNTLHNDPGKRYTGDESCSGVEKLKNALKNLESSSWSKIKDIFNINRAMNATINAINTTVNAMQTKLSSMHRGIKFLILMALIYSGVYSYQNVDNFREWRNPILRTNRILRQLSEEFLGAYSIHHGIHKNRAFEILGQPHGVQDSSDINVEKTMHKLFGCRVYLFFEKGSDVVQGIVMELDSTDSKTEVEIPIGTFGGIKDEMFILGRDTYADMSRILLRDQYYFDSFFRGEHGVQNGLPQLFSYVDSANNILTEVLRDNYTEYIGAVHRRCAVILSTYSPDEWNESRYFDVFYDESMFKEFIASNREDGDIEEDSDFLPYNNRQRRDERRRFTEKRAWDLYPTSQDQENISPAYNKVYIDSKKERIFWYDEDTYTLNTFNFGYIFVVDRLNTDEMSRYMSYRETSRPSILGVFYNRGFAENVFAKGRGILDPREDLRLPAREDQ